LISEWTHLCRPRVGVFHQFTLLYSNTIGSKELFKTILLDHDVSAKSYHFDNGALTSADFTTNISYLFQGYYLSGVVTHQ
jgi:hypothetical protein